MGLLLLSLLLAQESGEPRSLYRLEAGDEIEVRHFYNAELNEKGLIRPDGRFSLPLLGEVTAAGQTVGDLQRDLEAKYKPIVRQVALTVQVRAFANRKAFIGGEVLRPGMIVLNGRQTALAAILEAGGPRPTANRQEALVIRRSPKGEAATIRLALNPARKGLAPASEFALEPLDVVVLDRSGVAKANQFVDQYLRQMMPMLLTGGFTYLFNYNGAAGALR